MAVTYWVFYCNEDGEVSVQRFASKVDIEAYLTDCAKENTEEHTPTYYGPTDRIPTDMQYWGDKRLIIKGELVVPEPVEMVRTFTLP